MYRLCAEPFRFAAFLRCRSRLGRAEVAAGTKQAGSSDKGTAGSLVRVEPEGYALAPRGFEMETNRRTRDRNPIRSTQRTDSPDVGITQPTIPGQISRTDARARCGIADALPLG